MTIDYSTEGQVHFSILDYIDLVVNKTPVELLKSPYITATANHLFKVNPNAKKLDTSFSIIYHHLVAQLLYLGKRTHPGILPAVSLLCTRVQEPDKDDWKKLGSCIRFLRDIRDDPLTLSDHGTATICWWIDASFAVHHNLRSHTGATMSMGKGCLISISTKQKLNTRSSTEA